MSLGAAVRRKRNTSIPACSPLWRAGPLVANSDWGGAGAVAGPSWAAAASERGLPPRCAPRPASTFPFWPCTGVPNLRLGRAGGALMVARTAATPAAGCKTAPPLTGCSTPQTVLFSATLTGNSARRKRRDSGAFVARQCLKPGQPRGGPSCRCLALVSLALKPGASPLARPWPPKIVPGARFRPRTTVQEAALCAGCCASPWALARLKGQAFDLKLRGDSARIGGRAEGHIAVGHLSGSLGPPTSPCGQEGERRSRPRGATQVAWRCRTRPTQRSSWPTGRTGYQRGALRAKPQKTFAPSRPSSCPHYARQGGFQRQVQRVQALGAAAGARRQRRRPVAARHADGRRRGGRAAPQL